MFKQGVAISEGNVPILISMPHNGVSIPEDIANSMTESSKQVADTDWYLDRLYDFVTERGCYLIKPEYNRYVIDLNRSDKEENLYPGQDTTELCPTTQFNRQAIYKSGCLPDQKEINRRIENYWRPYHNQLKDTINKIKNEFGGALLFEAHSIRSHVPRFFKGKLPDFNFGTYDGNSCSEILSNSISEWEPKSYSKVVNGRFKGGYITREYGDPKNNIHSIQLELSQAAYMNEDNLEFEVEKASRVKMELNKMFDLFFSFIEKI